MARPSWLRKFAQFIQPDLKTRELKETFARDSAICDDILECLPAYELSPVAIIGAGVAGMRAAMMLDHLGMPYEIFEASQRHGGRCYTYRFTHEEDSSLKHDYFDVGAMRFPQIPAMRSLFALFEELGITPEGGPGGKLVPFIDSTPVNILMYNSELRFRCKGRLFNSVQISRSTHAKWIPVAITFTTRIPIKAV